jgi:hypothetical protein
MALVGLADRLGMTVDELADKPLEVIATHLAYCKIISEK